MKLIWRLIELLRDMQETKHSRHSAYMTLAAGRTETASTAHEANHG